MKCAALTFPTIDHNLAAQVLAYLLAYGETYAVASAVAAWLAEWLKDRFNLLRCQAYALIFHRHGDEKSCLLALMTCVQGNTADDID